MSVKVLWDGATRSVQSTEELQHVVDTVRAAAEPIMLFLEHANGRSLVVGLGHAESVLTFVESDGVTSFHSVGDTNRSDMLVFRCRGQLDEFFGEMAVAEDAAIEAAHEFLRTGARPESVQWEADW